MKTIELTNCDEVALVDDEDYPRVMGYKWNATKYQERIRRIQTTIALPWMILNITPEILNGRCIDHRNRDPLNNCKKNLRYATTRQNQWNRRANRNATSQYKGVFKSEDPRKGLVYWCSNIKVNGTQIYLGYFPYTPVGEIAAARAYDAAARQHFGRFACLNFPDEDPLGIQLPFPGFDIAKPIQEHRCPLYGQPYCPYHEELHGSG